MKKFIIIFVVLSLVAVFATNAFAGAKKAAVEKKNLVYISWPASFDAYWIVNMKTLEKELQKMGYETKVVDTENDLTKQLDQLDSAIALDPAAIVCGPMDSWGVVSAIDKAKEAGIPVIAWGRQIKTTVDATELADNIRIAEMGGERAVELLIEKYGEPKGKILQITGDLGDAVAHEFMQGLEKALANYPNIKLVTKTAEAWAEENAIMVAEDALHADPEIDLIYAHVGFFCVGIKGVLEKMGYGPRGGDKPHFLMVTLTGDPNGLQLFREGWTDGDVDQPAVKEAIGTAVLTDMVLKGKEISVGDSIDVMGTKCSIVDSEFGPLLMVPGTVITEKNVDSDDLWGNYQM